MNGEQTRDAMVVALRRDLLGPLADPSGCYPGATTEADRPRAKLRPAIRSPYVVCRRRR